MSQYIKIGNNAIKTSSIISAQKITVEYPYRDADTYETEKLARKVEKQDSIFSILGTLHSLSNIGKQTYEMRQGEVLQLQISVGMGTKMLWLNNDDCFSAALLQIKETNQFSKAHAEPLGVPDRARNGGCFSSALPQIKATNQFSRAQAVPLRVPDQTKYEKACWTFAQNLPEIFPLGEPLDSFLDALTTT